MFIRVFGPHYRRAVVTAVAVAAAIAIGPAVAIALPQNARAEHVTSTYCGHGKYQVPLPVHVRECAEHQRTARALVRGRAAEPELRVLPSPRLRPQGLLP